MLTDHPVFRNKSFVMIFNEASGHPRQPRQLGNKLSVLRFITFVVVALSSALLISACGNEAAPLTAPVAAPAPLPLFYALEHKSAAVSIGIWMFHEGRIANWLDRKYELVFYPDCSRVATKGGTVSLFEPINVVWLDFASDTEEEARLAIVRFLENQTASFIQEPPETGTPPIPAHGTGYYTFIGGSQRYDQYPSDMTWTDAVWPLTNNHARVFSAHQGNVNEAPFFVSTASFSREANAVTTVHSHISFDCARDVLEPLDNWSELELKHFGNEYPPGTEGTDPGGIRFHTGDHSGVRVFVLEAPPDSQPAGCGLAYGSADDTYLKIVNRLDTHIDIHISSLEIPGPAAVNYGGIVNENSCDLYGLVSNHTVDVTITQCNSGDYEEDGFPVDCGFGGPKETMRITPAPGVTSTVEVMDLYFGGSDALFVPGMLGLRGARALCGESHLAATGTPMTDAEWDNLVASHTEAHDDGLSRNNAIVFGNFTCGSEANVLCIRCNVALVEALWP